MNKAILYIRKVFLCYIALSCLCNMLLSSPVFAFDLIQYSVLTAEEKAYMQGQEVYYVGYTDNYIPISYHVDGELTGIAVDVLNAIAEEIGITLEYVDLDAADVDFDALDISIQMDNFTEKKISDVYITYQSVLATHTDYEGEILFVAGFDHFGLTQIDEVIQDKQIIYYPNFVMAKDAFDAGQTDALLMATLGYEKVVEEVEAGTYTLEVLDTPVEFVFTYSDSFDDEKIDIINKQIQNLHDGNMILLTQQHNNYIQRTYTILDTLVANADIVGMGFVTGIVFISVSILLWQRKKRKELEDLMSHDRLTGILSEDKFKEEVKRILREHPTQIYHIMAVDMDNFKGINEMYGYTTGSEILKQTAQCMCDTLESVEHIMTRNFADNFFVLISGENVKERLTGSEEGYRKLKNKLSETLGADYKFSFSIGIYTITNPKEDISLMMDCAVTARDKGKHNLGYTVHFYTDKMRIARKVRNTILATMDSDVHDREVVVYYQPKVNLRTGIVVGAEALVRWKQEGVLVAPCDFIPSFEKNGFIGTLDHFVLDSVCQFVKYHADMYLPPISINLSGLTIMQEKLVEDIVEVVNKYRIPPSQIQFEITESAFVDKFEDAVQRLEHLREVGFRIAMDDFGVGVSTLHRLRDIPLDTLKMDREFISTSVDDEKGWAIIESVVHMAKEINLETVAEGIETKAQHDFLKVLGCDIGQGFYYSKPLEEEAYVDYLLDNE